MGHLRRSSTYEMLTDVNPDVAALVFDKVVMECESTNPPPSEASCLNTSAVGPGLDSDFGASAGTLQSPLAAVNNMTVINNTAASKTSRLYDEKLT